MARSTSSKTSTSQRQTSTPCTPAPTPPAQSTPRQPPSTRPARARWARSAPARRAPTLGVDSPIRIQRATDKGSTMRVEQLSLWSGRRVESAFVSWSRRLLSLCDTEPRCSIGRFGRNEIPSDLQGSATKPNPESWGTPVAAWSSSSCNIANEVKVGTLLRPRDDPCAKHTVHFTEAQYHLRHHVVRGLGW
jgi:hypothetical protein